MIKVFIIEDKEKEVEKRINKIPLYNQSNVYFDLKIFFQSPVLIENENSDQRPNTIVFIHKNNDSVMEETQVGNYGDWIAGATLLTNTALRVCRAGGRVVVFSGGVRVDEGLEPFREKLREYGYVEGHHFGIVSLNEIKENNTSLEGLDEIPKKWWVDTLFEKTMFQMQHQRLSLFIHSHFIPVLVDLRILQDVQGEKKNEAEEKIRLAAIGKEESGYLDKIVNNSFKTALDENSEFLMKINHKDIQSLADKWQGLIKMLPTQTAENPDNCSIVDILGPFEAFYRGTAVCLEEIDKMIQESSRES